MEITLCHNLTATAAAKKVASIIRRLWPDAVKDVSEQNGELYWRVFKNDTVAQRCRDLVAKDPNVINAEMMSILSTPKQFTVSYLENLLIINQIRVEMSAQGTV